MSRSRILVVAANSDTPPSLEMLCRRRSLIVNRVPSGASALILTGNRRYDLIIINGDLPDMSVDEFMGSLRTLDSNSAYSRVVVLTETAEPVPFRELVNEDLISVSPQRSDFASVFQELISALLGAAVRCATRVLVQLDVHEVIGRTTRLYQSKNLSETGILLAGAKALPVGSKVRFELRLPDELEPVLGDAVVVRHTTPEEEIQGFALKFDQLARLDALRLQSYVAACEGKTASVGSGTQQTATDDGPLQASI